MIEQRTQTDEKNAHIIGLVSTALRQNGLSGLSEMLRTIAQSVNAYGCILWQVTPGSDLDATPPRGYLFVLAQWLQDKHPFALHDLPLGSVSGEAVLTQKSVNIRNIWSDSRVFKRHPFLREAGIKTMCSVPITFIDKTKGAVNLYRKIPIPLTESEVLEVEQLASLVPALYQTVRDNVSLSLIRTVDEILNEAELRSANFPLSLDETKKVFQAICDQVSNTFQCVETSIFLEDHLEAPRKFGMMATTWPGHFKKFVYAQSAGEGLTGWVLARAKPVKILDLAHFDRDKDSIRRDYPELTWRDSLDIKRAVHSFLNLTSEAELPPLSFMAVPIVMGDKVLGVIRCCTAKQGPYYFANPELGLLTLVAAQIGRYASNWLGRCEMQEENKSWQALVQSVNKLNRSVQKELAREAPDELRIFEEALRVTGSVITSAEIMDVRLIDEQTNELYFAATHGSAWNEGSEIEIRERKGRRYSIRGEVTSAGAFAFQTGRLYIIANVRNDPYYSETFPGVTRMIIAPISVEHRIFGVVDIRGTGESEFPRHAEAVAELLGQQLGLYYYLATTIRKLRKAETDLKGHVAALQKFQRQQAQTFENLEHQFRSPIIQAYARIQSVLEVTSEGRLQSNLRAVRGLCGKAKRVSMSTGLFAKLAREEPIQPNRRRLLYDYLVKTLIEAAADHELMTDPSRRIAFRVDRKSHNLLRAISVDVDHDLLEQAISNLLDNAAKYSFSRTNVDIYWGLTGSERFHITVVNKGLPVHPGDVRRCPERGWRGSLAEVTTGEGSGIGLWIVDNIMKAHNGELIIVPTTPEDATEVKLVFPASKS